MQTHGRHVPRSLSTHPGQRMPPKRGMLNVQTCPNPLDLRGCPFTNQEPPTLVLVCCAASYETELADYVSRRCVALDHVRAA